MWTSFSARYSALCFAVLCVGALSACDRVGGSNSGAGGPTIGSVVAPEPVVDAVPQEEPAVARSLWRAANNAAANTTGNLRVSLASVRGGPVILAFATGVTMRAQPIAVSPASEQSGVNNATFAALLGADPRVDVNLYRVQDETVVQTAPQGGLCGAARTSYLIISEFVDQREHWVFRVGAFRGQAPPGVRGANPQYCGAYAFEAP